MMQKVKLLLGTSALFFLVAAILTAGIFIKSPTNVTQKAAGTVNLFFDASIKNVKPGVESVIKVKMDTGGSKVIGMDLVINFNPSHLQIRNVQKGDDIGSLNNVINNDVDNANGVISFTAFTLDRNETVDGSDLDVLLIKLVATGETEGTEITFDDQTAISASGNDSNVLLGRSSATIIISDPTPTPTPEETATPTSTPTNAPNSCGGTCGSNFNCASNLFCYQGRCRNPSCPAEGGCNCDAATTTPTPTRTPTRTPTVRPTATVKTTKPTATAIVINLETPVPTDDKFWEKQNEEDATPEPAEIQPTPTPVEFEDTTTSKFLPWIIGSLAVAGTTLLLIVIGLLREMRSKKSRPPVIKV